MTAPHLRALTPGYRKVKAARICCSAAPLRAVATGGLERVTALARRFSSSRRACIAAKHTQAASPKLIQSPSSMSRTSRLDVPMDSEGGSADEKILFERTSNV